MSYQFFFSNFLYKKITWFTRRAIKQSYKPSYQPKKERWKAPRIGSRFNAKMFLICEIFRKFVVNLHRKSNSWNSRSFRVKFITFLAGDFFKKIWFFNFFIIFFWIFLTSNIDEKTWKWICKTLNTKISCHNLQATKATKKQARAKSMSWSFYSTYYNKTSSFNLYSKLT